MASGQGTLAEDLLGGLGTFDPTYDGGLFPSRGIFSFREPAPAEAGRAADAHAEPRGHGMPHDFGGDVAAEDISSDATDNEGEGAKKIRKKAKKEKKEKKKYTYDDLYYDPQADDQDQAWVDQQRLQSMPRNSSVQDLPECPRLSCPCCLSHLSFDCQQHERYQNQFRAMFVQNCNVIRAEVLRFQAQEKKQKQPKRKRGRKDDERARATAETTRGTFFLDNNTDGMDMDTEGVAGAAPGGAGAGAGAGEDVYHPVRCAVCDTEVGVQDADEVFHFFNVVAS